MRALRSRVGLVFQYPEHQLFEIDVFTDVCFGPKNQGLSKEETQSRAREALTMVGLDESFYKQSPFELSGGQKRRVAIAGVLAMEPEVLILDEPTAGQDFRHYTEIMEFLKEINDRLGITIIMITHDMHLMLEYTDRAIVIADGELIADDIPANVLTSETIADKAYLKKTSLYDLAVKCDIPDPSGFVERFIYFEREERANG